VARYLGPYGMGVVALLLLVPNLLGRFLELGLGGASIHRLGKDEGELDFVHGNLLALLVLAALVVGGLLLLAGVTPLRSLFPDVERAYLVLALALAPAALYVNVWQLVLAALERQRLAYRTLALVQVAYLLGVGALVIAGAALEAFVLLVGALFLLRALAAFRTLTRLHARPRYDTTRFRESLRFGRAVYAGAVLTYVLHRTDQLVCAQVLGTKELGYYALAATLAEYLWILTTVVGQSVLRKVTAGSEEEAVEATCQVSRQAVLLGLLGGALVAVLAYPFVLLVYSRAFLPTVVPLLILLPGVTAFAVKTNLLAYVSYREGRPWRSAAAHAVAVVVHLPVLLLLVGRLGIAGAAIATTAGYLVLLYVAGRFFIASTGCRWSDFLLPRRNDLRAYARLLSDLRRPRDGS
jgi:O-antigen/teichoic acid export membrane protein